MISAIAFFLALFAAQAATPAAPPTEPAASPATTQSAPAPKPCGLDATGKYHVGCGVTAPRLVYHVEPQFPKEARDEKFMGIVDVALTVDADGNPENVRVFRSVADRADKQHRHAALSLDQAAVDGVKKYKFAPATYQGKPVPVDLIVEVNFKIF